MISFSPLRTSRLNLVFSELSFQDAIHLCKLPVDLFHAGVTDMISRIAKPGPNPGPKAVDDPLLWTVQERALVMAHYISYVSEAGADFAIGAHGRLSDYQIEDRPDYPAGPVELGQIGGHDWVIHPLQGIHAECIELLVIAGKLPEGFMGWWLGCMAAQLQCDGVGAPSYAEVGRSALEKYIEDAAKLMMAMPERDTHTLIAAFLDALPALDHLFHMGIAEDGLAFLPREGGAGLPPARFPVAAGLSSATKSLFGNHDK